MKHEIIEIRTTCDCCGKIEPPSHLIGRWEEIRGAWDLCELCSSLLKQKLIQKANIEDLEDIILSLKKPTEDTALSTLSPIHFTSLIN